MNRIRVVMKRYASCALVFAFLWLLHSVNVLAQTGEQSGKQSGSRKPILKPAVLSDVEKNDSTWKLEPASIADLKLPQLSEGQPAAGKKVSITPKEYENTNVFHTLYLPSDWKAAGERLPIIFEYTGNFFPASGSTGQVEDAGLGFGLSGGKYIWVSLPFINAAGNANEVTWWGDESATIGYAKRNVPRIIEQFNADPERVFLCGFSRGSIGINYIGLHDDEISKLWSAFVTHDHFDGVREWRGTSWGSPLEKYRAESVERLKRVGERPYLVCQNGNSQSTMAFIKSSLSKDDSQPNVGNNFVLNAVSTIEIFGEFPNGIAKHPHTDRWLLKPSRYREATWSWMNRVATKKE
ncbi:MAG: hypothetical protein AB8B55_06265 [Mariniblastus sp.]